MLYHSSQHYSRTESTGRTPSTGNPPRNPTQPATRQVVAQNGSAEDIPANPLDLLLSDPEDDTVRQIRITDQGSGTRSARVEIHGVPAQGIVDTTADITIMGGQLFKEVASVARLRKKDFKPADKTPRTYSRQPFSLDGRMDLDVTFGDKTMQTPVYIKMDAPDQLLLSEGVCRQLGIVTYHQDVSATQKDRRTDKEKEGVRAVTHVNMVRTIYLLPYQSMAVPVKIKSNGGNEGPLLVESDSDLEKATGLQVEYTLVQLTIEGLAHVIISNMTGCSSYVSAGTVIGEAAGVEIVEDNKPRSHDSASKGAQTSEEQADESLVIRNIKSVDDRKEELRKLIGKPKLLDKKQTKDLLNFITDHHTAFCLDIQERGETNLVEMEIHTGDEAPRKVAARRMPFAVCQEVAK